MVLAREGVVGFPTVSTQTQTPELAEALADELVAGGTLRDVGAAHGLSGERVRQLLLKRPDLVRRVEDSRAARVEQRRAGARAAQAAASQGRRATPKAGLQRWTDDELDNFFRRFLAAHDGRASSQAFKTWCGEHGPPSPRTFVMRFGPGWADVCARYGVAAPGGRGKTVDARTCERAVRRVAKIVGGPPTVQQYKDLKRPDEPSDQTVRGRLGDGRWAGVVARLLA